MDGMNYYGKDFSPVPDTRAADLAAVRPALFMTVVSAGLIVGGCIALDWAGWVLPIADEFPIPS